MSCALVQACTAVVPGGEAVISVIERAGWELYEVTLEVNQDDCFPFDALDALTPASCLRVGASYLLTPQRKQGQTCLDAYEETNQHPVIVVGDAERMRWEVVTCHTNALNFIFFSHIICGMDAVIVIAPSGANMPSPLIAMPYESVVDAFETCFKTITTEEVMDIARLMQYHGGRPN